MAPFGSESLRQYQHADNPPWILIGMYERQLWDSPKFHMENILPHLMSAYNQWSTYIGEQDLDKETRAAYVEADDYICNSLVGSLILSYNISLQQRAGGSNSMLELNADSAPYNREGFNELFPVLQFLEKSLYHAEIVPESGSVYTPESIRASFQAFETFTLYREWEKFYRQTVIPFAMEFPQTVTLLPEVIAMGEIVLRRTFDRFYLPTFVNHPKYREHFYAYFADKYEREADMNVKRGVFAGLFNLMHGDNLHVLDAACGSGLGYINRPADRVAEMVGIDESGSMVRLADLAGEKAFEGRIEEATRFVGEGKFDYAMASFWDYWEMESEKLQAWNELRKTLKPGGKFVFNVHKPLVGWEERYKKLLTEECGYASVSFSEEKIERTGGGVYTAYYVVAEV